ncbi:hypothetical protein T552_03339 [Pneumocystis carinii B80]|uniref:CNH domain-containing protein n=1 Tax=Pneumocystis carinii (strain B80) TaxID=1408658 RepID=A0A0W4ZBD1_PNEC8|nr:hypothetical protein T552_03339 [Pneumocystis carinii B80]KTW25727.1 hypothetical protein T552_03339 [Pneumocystis carinii B80]
MQFVQHNIKSLFFDKIEFRDSEKDDKGLKVTVIETDGINLYIGTSYGYVYHFVLENRKNLSLFPEFIFASKHNLLERKLVKSIFILSQITLVLILCGNVLFFCGYPELSPVSGLGPIKDVVDICQDLDKFGETELDGSVILTVLMKRKIKRIKVKDTISVLLDIHCSSVVSICQRGFICCVATISSYELINFENNRRIPLFPIIQGNDALHHNFLRISMPFLKPIIISISKSEFAVTCLFNGKNYVGLFVDINGNIVRGTIMFSEYPISLASEFPFLMALMDNSFVEIHNIIDQTLVQVVQSPFLGSITNIFRTFGHFCIFSESLMKKIVMVKAMSSKDPETQDHDIQNNKLLEEMDIATRLSSIPSKVFLTGENGISCLVFDSILVYVDELLNSKEIDDVLIFIKDITKIITPENIHSERIYHEISYIRQISGFVYLEKILFDDAIIQFEESDIDPRLVISLFPVFDVKLDGIMAYKGVDEIICRLVDIDNIISSEIIGKFDSYVQLSHEETETAQNYRKILYQNALNTLKKYLLKYRQRKELGSIGTGYKNKQIFQVVDLTLLKLLVYLSPEEDSNVLYKLVDSGIECFDDAIIIFEENKKYFLLSKLYQNMKMQNKVLEIWKNILDGNMFDHEFIDGETKMKDYLFEVDDDNLRIDYTIWLLERMQHIGIEFFVSIDSKKPFGFSTDEMVNIFRSRSKICLKIYLEYLVSNFSNLSFLNELLLLYLDEINNYLQIPLIRNATEKSIKDYSESNDDKLSYFEYLSTCMIENDERYQKFVSNRIKLIEYLQSVSDYDFDLVLKHLHSQKDILLIELVILYGRFSRHEEALTILVQTLRDYKTSEIYCYHRGLLVKSYYHGKDSNEFLLQRKNLFKILLDQYLRLPDYDQKLHRISFLLKHWNIYLDSVYVLNTISNHWSIDKFSDFLITILQKNFHEKYHSFLIKSLHRGLSTIHDYSNLISLSDNS